MGSRLWRRLLFRCLACGKVLRRTKEALRCPCGQAYPLMEGVPLLLPEWRSSPTAAPLTDAQLGQVVAAFGIRDDAATRARFAAIFSQTYQFDDSFLEAENNYLLQRLNIDRQARPTVETLAAPGQGEPAFAVVRHYVPATLARGAATSHNVRIRNTGPEPLLRHAREGWSLAFSWNHEPAAAATPLPVTLLPGRELTLPARLAAPATAGPAELRVLLLHPSGRRLAAPERLPVTIVEHLSRPYPPLAPPRGPLVPDYDEDHRIGIRLVERAIQLARARRGLEIASSSSPATCNFGCLTVNIDIDAQTMQAAHLVFSERGYTNVIFAYCDAARLPFAPATFDFVATFAALHHFADPVSVLREAARVVRPGGFIAVMCEPTGHELGEPRANILEVLEHGVNEQIFSLDEYAAMFHAAGLRPASAQLDDDSLKVILRR